MINTPTSRRRKRSVFGATLLAAVVGATLAVATVPAGAQDTETSCGTAPAGMNVIEANASYIRGTSGDDFICGGASVNVIRGLAGDDIIFGGGGNDRLIGGSGDDIVYGGDGADKIIAYGGADVLYGGDGDDTILGGYGADEMYGEAGTDILSGGFGADQLHGGDGDDRVIGGKGTDTLAGDDGDDRLFGGWGIDEIDGGAGDDIMFGGYAADTLIGGAGTDTIYSADVDTVYEDDVPATSSYLGSYTLDDAEFGTQVVVTVDGSTRTIVANALPDHETGEFPTAGNPNTISAQDVTYEYTTEPTFTGGESAPLTTGVAVNGVKFQPGTAETVTCTTGGTFRVEALQDVYNLGLDFNNAHVQPTGAYHYHGVSELLVDAYSTGDDLVHVGFAADGFLMYYSKSGAYESGYALSTNARSGTDCVGSAPLGGDTVSIEGTSPDGTFTSDWEWSDANGDLDECNGVEIDGEYAYIITNEYPYISRCLNGETAGDGPGGPGGPPPGQ